MWLLVPNLSQIEGLVVGVVLHKYVPALWSAAKAKFTATKAKVVQVETDVKKKL